MSEQAGDVRPRLGYLIPEFPSQTHTFFWREIQALRKLGAEVEIISTRRPAAGVCKHEFAEEGRLQAHYVFPPSIAATLQGSARCGRRLSAGVRYVGQLEESSLKQKLVAAGMILCAVDLFEHCHNKNIRHIHGHSCAQAAHILALCHRLGGPSYSLTLHGNLRCYGRDHRSKTATASFVAMDGGHLLDEVVNQAGFPRERCLVTCMGLDVGRHCPPAHREAHHKKLKMLTVARLNPAKGHIHALRAMKQAVDGGCDVHYTLAGGGENGYDAVVREEIARLGLGSRVEQLGTVSEEGVLKLLREVDAFVLPSVGAGEAWPISVMEAMSCGLPVVSSIIGSTPDMISDGVDGILVGQGDEEALAGAMKRLAENVELRKKLGVAARMRAVRCFDVQVTARRLYDWILRSQDRINESGGCSGARAVVQRTRGEAEVDAYVAEQSGVQST